MHPARAGEDQGRSTPSSRSRCSLTASPPVYPPRPPPARSTRWQGTTIGIGFAPSALPAAREACGRAHLSRHLRVRRGSAEGDAGTGGEDRPAERGDGVEIDREVEVVPIAVEVLAELTSHRFEPRRSVHDAWGDPLREQLEHRVDAPVPVDVGQAREALGGRGRQQGADGRVELAVHDLGLVGSRGLQPRGGRGQSAGVGRGGGTAGS